MVKETWKTTSTNMGNIHIKNLSGVSAVDMKKLEIILWWNNSDIYFSKIFLITKYELDKIHKKVFKTDKKYDNFQGAYISSFHYLQL